jgi:hypothetical protein
LNTLLSPVVVEEESLHLVVVVLVVIAQAFLVSPQVEVLLLSPLQA